MTKSAKIVRKPADNENIWKEELLDAATVSWVLSPDNVDNPCKLIHDMLMYEYQIALDPMVSMGAKVLHDRIAYLEAQLAEGKQVVYGLEEYHIEHEIECPCRYQGYNQRLECTCGLYDACKRAAKWVKGVGVA